MGDAALTAAFEALVDSQTRYTRRMAVTIADMADDTPRRTTLRLEDMGLLKKGSWDWFVINGGITPNDVREIRRDRRPAT